jgi:hypothetical protein
VSGLGVVNLCAALADLVALVGSLGARSQPLDLRPRADGDEVDDGTPAA